MFLEQVYLLSDAEAVDILAELLKLGVEVVGASIPLVLPDGAEPAVRRFVVLRRPLAHAQVEDTLEVVDLFRLFDEAVRRQMLAGNRLVNVEVVLEMLRHLRRFDALVLHAVVRRLDVVPWEFAESLEREPETEVREEEERLSLVFISRKLFVDHIHEDKPRFVVLRPLERQEVAAPLGDGFLAAVFGSFEPLADHADLHHGIHISAVFFRKMLARYFNTFAAGYRKFVRSARDAVDQLHDVGLASEVEV